MTSSNKQLINLASARLGATAVYATDDFFADKSRMLEDQDPVFIEGKYDDNGKWMDGWESRRRRDSGHDYAVIKLAATGRIHEIEIDTRHFTGNYAPAASIEACLTIDEIPGDDAEWVEILSPTALNGNDQRLCAVQLDSAVSHLRLHIYPDGGVARLRVYGTPKKDWSDVSESELVDLAASLNGGVALDCNDAHFGSMHNLLAPGRGINMGDGWETRRRREPGYDWTIIKLGHAGDVKRIDIDTAHFKGNFPHQCIIQAAFISDAEHSSIGAQSLYWQELLPAQHMQADHIHSYSDEILEHDRVNYIRLNIVPDGGVSRLRIFGNITRD
jgi:allantoicase